MLCISLVFTNVLVSVFRLLLCHLAQTVHVSPVHPRVQVTACVLSSTCPCPNGTNLLGMFSCVSHCLSEDFHNQNIRFKLWLFFFKQNVGLPLSWFKPMYILTLCHISRISSIACICGNWFSCSIAIQWLIWCALLGNFQNVDSCMTFWHRPLSAHILVNVNTYTSQNQLKSTS